MELQRTVNLLELLKKNSFFLLGPRATGKSHLIKTQLSKQSRQTHDSGARGQGSALAVCAGVAAQVNQPTVAVNS